MTKKIFRSFMVSAAAVLLAAVAIVMTCLYSYFASVQENQLQDQLQPPPRWKPRAATI